MGYIHNLADIPEHKRPVGKLKVLSGAQNMVFWGKLDAGTMAPRHSHPNEQITWLVKGTLRTAIGDEPEVTVEAGQIMVIPAGVEHETSYVTDCEIVEFFSPPRADMFPTASPDNPYAKGS
jgi:quercetin dioxygenase-like cupin family protein